ncbi:hypothetical protein C1645_824732 [Glomus cerebriforme]|uniref:Uncharacterized protein n=1 Tax=Glomus cerebriforme TaxID=658196 RepID=A0A397SY51_9GLOM|nr:hypothetical protein C1645_824732 [Glomus cerebriforme]
MKRPRTYRLTKYIKILGKQNSCNTYAACIACVENLENNELLKNTFTNKKPQVKNHLKNCPYFREKIGNPKELDDIIYLTDNEVEREEEEMKEVVSVKSSSSTSTALSAYNYSRKNSIESNLIRRLNKKEIPKFERLLLRMSVANGFSFQWVDHSATLEFFEFLSPLLVLPKRKTLSNRILNRETTDLNALRDEKLINDQIGVVLAFDEWKNILDQHIFGSLFITSLGEVLIWDTSDISSELSDSAPAYAEARGRLQLEYPEIIFLPCFAHQCQLAIGDIFKESLTLKTASSKAITVAAYFKNANNSYFIALRNLAIRYECPQVISGNTNELYLNSEFCQVLLDNNWPTRLLLEFENFRQKVEPFNNETFEQFGDDIFKFWTYIKGEYKELGAVALKIFGICVNATSVERMWSSMGFVHTVRHNRLTNDKVLAMSQLRASINFSLRGKELQQNKTQFLDSNIETEIDNPEVPEDVENIGEDNSNIITSKHWGQALNEWDKMLMEEEIARMEDEEALRDNLNNNMEGDLLSEYMHPAIDKNAKWELRNLFSSSLNTPDYLTEMSNM